jgi:hypothetical protein
VHLLAHSINTVHLLAHSINTVHLLAHSINTVHLLAHSINTEQIRLSIKQRTAGLYVQSSAVRITGFLDFDRRLAFLKERILETQSVLLVLRGSLIPSTYTYALYCHSLITSITHMK